MNIKSIVLSILSVNMVATFVEGKCRRSGDGINEVYFRKIEKGSFSNIEIKYSSLDLLRN